MAPAGYIYPTRFEGDLKEKGLKRFTAFLLHWSLGFEGDLKEKGLKRQCLHESLQAGNVLKET